MGNAGFISSTVVPTMKTKSPSSEASFKRHHHQQLNLTVGDSDWGSFLLDSGFRCQVSVLWEGARRIEFTV